MAVSKGTGSALRGHVETTTLRTILTQLIAGVGAVSAVGCADQVCTTTFETYESPLPPRLSTQCADAGRRNDGSLDASVDGDGAPVTSSCADAGTIDEWLALPCETACHRIWPDKEITGCSRSQRDAGVEAFVLCDVTTTSCRPYHIMAGRPARDFVPTTHVSDELGGWFAHLAEIEAASVQSFLDLARDLRNHGIADRLVREARRSARDERRHAWMMRRLAERVGAKGVRTPRAPRRAPMTLGELAIANVSEGCVGELFAAAIATWVESHAKAPEHRAIFGRIARDETRHAAFALTLERELGHRLCTADRARVAKEGREAARTLRRTLVERAALVATGLHPPRSVQEAALTTLAGRFWS